MAAIIKRPVNLWRIMPAPVRIFVVILMVVVVGISGYQLYQVGLVVKAKASTAIYEVKARFAAPLRPSQSGKLAPLFSPQVAYWEDDIIRWGEEYDIEPNLLATVMQIESCGHPTVNSYAGAQGLFQVMPFHFAETENMLDPDTNAMRGASFLKQCIGWANGDIGLALACYNGGPSVLQRSPAYWDQQVHDYYNWGVPIYADALVHKSESETLTRWMNAGGARLCDSATTAIQTRQ